eukprot:683252-Prymnesium_polylepis.1
MLPLKLFRSYSLRHGAARSFKKLKSDPSKAAAHLCMRPEVYESVYGVEDAITTGEELTSMVGRKA